MPQHLYSPPGSAHIKTHSKRSISHSDAVKRMRHTFSDQRQDNVCLNDATSLKCFALSLSLSGKRTIKGRPEKIVVAALKLTWYRFVDRELYKINQFNSENNVWSQKIHSKLLNANGNAGNRAVSFNNSAGKHQSGTCQPILDTYLLI